MHLHHIYSLTVNNIHEYTFSVLYKIKAVPFKTLKILIEVTRKEKKIRRKNTSKISGCCLTNHANDYKYKATESTRPLFLMKS